MTMRAIAVMALLMLPWSGCEDPPEPPGADASASRDGGGDGGSRAEAGPADVGAVDLRPAADTATDQGVTDAGARDAEVDAPVIDGAAADGPGIDAGDGAIEGPDDGAGGEVGQFG